MFHPLPEVAAALPGDESEFSREFDGRIRERFPIGSSEDKLIDFLTNEGFLPDRRRRDNPSTSLFVQSGLICKKIVRVVWEADATGALNEVRGSYETRGISGVWRAVRPADFWVHPSQRARRAS